LIFVGDVHGKTKQLEQYLWSPERIGKRVFQLGDMGIGFKGVTLREFSPKYFLWIRGNHDAPDWCRQHPNYAGDYGYLPEDKLFFLGGAWSIDWKWRVEGISWWHDEELSIEELNKAHQIYIDSKPEIVATHEAPTAAALEMLNNLVLAKRTEAGYTDSTLAKGEDYEYYKAKLGCANTRTSQALQQMFEIHQPKHWVFGHYHVRKDFTINGTQFHCLPELDTLEINNADV
jgi:hypothetical protein